MLKISERHTINPKYVLFVETWDNQTYVHMTDSITLKVEEQYVASLMITLDTPTGLTNLQVADLLFYAERISEKFS